MLGLVLCWQDRAVLAKSADIWLLGQHVADMSATFPAKFLLDSSIFSGLIKQVMRPYVTSFALALGILSLEIKKIMSILFTWLGIPCTSCPSLLL